MMISLRCGDSSCVSYKEPGRPRGMEKTSIARESNGDVLEVSTYVNNF